MSFDYNYKFWVATQKDLEDILKRQEVYRRLKPIEDKATQHYLFADIYIRYVQLVDKLGYIYHHTFQVQKRAILADLLEAATNRLLELKNELKNIELSEFIYVDKTLIERRLTPDNILLWTPKYFPFWRPTNVQEIIYGPRKKGHEQRSEAFIPFIPSGGGSGGGAGGGEEKKADVVEQPKSRRSTSRKSMVTKLKMLRQEESTKKTDKKMVQNVEVITDPVKKRLMEAVRLIQCHERARVARVWQSNIRMHPKTYKPRERDDIIKYTFTHKPNQIMLVPIKRTSFNANYYAKRRSIVDFKYYVKPAWQTAARFSRYDQEEQEDDVSNSVFSEESDFPLQDQEEAFEMEDLWHSDEDELSNLEKESNKAVNMEEFFERLFNFSATRIQSYWRGYRDRKKYKDLLQQKSVIYGMTTNFKPKSLLVKAYEERVKEAVKHRLIKEKYDQEFIDFCNDERARILRVRAPWIMEDISDNIRDWFREFYDKLTAFHPYPDEMKGGTLLLLKGETLTVPEYHDKIKTKTSKEEKAKARQKLKAEKMKEKEKRKIEKIALAKRRAKMKAMGIVDFNDDMMRSKAIGKIEKTISTYKTQWQDIDEKLNRKQEPIKEWITSQYFCEIHQELQVTVDEMMRLEYELLRKALCKDLKKKYKKPKKKKPKKSKKKKKKTPLDITADRSIESLFYELQDAGIIKTYPKKTYEYYIGDRNLVAYDYLNIRMKDIAPYQEEMKDVLMAYALGMGPLNITKPKSILLVGPTNCGKKLLCNIFATEIDAVVFDISPETTASYQTDVKYLVHLITKMAKILQPTILFVNNVHRIFWKKIPPDMVEYKPRLLQAQLKKKVLKAIKKDDNVLLLGTTDAPWAANGKMKKLFQKIILVPRSEYASNFIVRCNVTMQYSGVPRDFDVSAMTLVTRDYISGDVVNNIQETLNLRRRMHLAARPLQAMEFLENFLDKDPPHFPMELKAWEKFAKWYRKSYQMARKRAKMMKMREKLLAQMKAKEDKKKKR